MAQPSFEKVHQLIDAIRKNDQSTVISLLHRDADSNSSADEQGYPITIHASLKEYRKRNASGA
jgi:hypothetical protein